MAARHPGAIDARVQHGALELANFLDLVAQRIGKALDHLGREADAHQFVLDRLLSRHIGGGTIAVGLVGRTHFREVRGHDVKLGQALDAQIFELLAAHPARRTIFVGIVGDARTGVFRTVIRIDQPVDDLVDLGLGIPHALDVIENFVDGGRASGNRHHHVLQAILDPLGDLDFAFAGEELNRTHFPHVHPHGIGRATEIGIHRRERGFSFVLDIIVACGNGRVFAQKQGFRVGSLVIDRNTHVAERADDSVDRLGIDQIIGQVVVDLTVSEITAILAQLDQELEAIAARFVFFRRNGATGDQVLGIAFATLAALGRLEVGQDFAFALDACGIVEIGVIAIGVLRGTPGATACADQRTGLGLGLGRLGFGGCGGDDLFRRLFGILGFLCGSSLCSGLCNCRLFSWLCGGLYGGL